MTRFEQQDIKCICMLCRFKCAAHHDCSPRKYELQPHENKHLCINRQYECRGLRRCSSFDKI